MSEFLEAKLGRSRAHDLARARHECRGRYHGPRRIFEMLATVRATIRLRCINCGVVEEITEMELLAR